MLSAFGLCPRKSDHADGVIFADSTMLGARFSRAGSLLPPWHARRLDRYAEAVFRHCRKNEPDLRKIEQGPAWSCSYRRYRSMTEKPLPAASRRGVGPAVGAEPGFSWRVRRLRSWTRLTRSRRGLRAFNGWPRCSRRTRRTTAGSISAYLVSAWSDDPGRRVEWNGRRFCPRCASWRRARRP